MPNSIFKNMLARYLPTIYTRNFQKNVAGKNLENRYKRSKKRRPSVYQESAGNGNLVGGIFFAVSWYDKNRTVKLCIMRLNVLIFLPNT